MSSDRTPGRPFFEDKRPFPRHRQRALRATVLAAILGFALQAQTPPPQQPTFRSEVNYVRVDVLPTQDGRPVEDLTKEEFELLEDGVPQRIEAFERVSVRPAGPQESRREPNNQRESDQMAADPRARVFVLFLDTYHVAIDASHNVRGPLVKLLDRLIGEDDLIGVMTPEMSAKNLVLARRTSTTEGFLTRYWTWGRRERLTERDPDEEPYYVCYPDAAPPPGSGCADTRGIADEMVERRRERRSLDAVEDLVRHLRGLREERKAILTISNGWKLFRPNESLARYLECQAIPGQPQIFVGPTGKLGTANERERFDASQYRCDADRLHLAQLDNEDHFRRLIDEANRSNATFYPVDPRGLAAFDTPIGPKPPLLPAADRRQLDRRVDTLRTLASATDGVAVVSQNDLDVGLKRVLDDLSSYYLLGYYSSNTKLDGAFRSITVRVKRPGVQVRARRGYRAATAEEVSAARAAADAPAGEAETAVSGAIARLAAIRPGARLHVYAAAMPRTPSAGDGSAGDGAASLWVVGELDSSLARSEDWRAGGKVSVTVTGAEGRRPERVVSADATIAPGGRSFLVRPAPLPPGDYIVRVRADPDADGALPLNEITRVAIPGPQADGADVVLGGQPLVSRRGPSTGVRYDPTADFRFRRNERIRVELPISTSALNGAARLLDRTGKPMAVPVTASLAEKADAPAKWVVAELALAPLAPGDYAIEVTAEQEGRKQVVVTAFRIVP